MNIFKEFYMGVKELRIFLRFLEMIADFSKAFNIDFFLINFRDFICRLYTPYAFNS